MALQRSVLTPQYSYDSATGRYRHDRSGRFVPRSEVRGALDKYLDAKSGQVRDLAQQLQRREVSLADWQRGTEREIALTHLASAAAAKGGWAQLTQADFGRVGSLVKAERKYLGRFAGQIEAGLPLDGRFVSRAGLYAQAGRHTFHVVRRQERGVRGLVRVRRILHARDSCEGCLRLAALGFQPVGSMPPPGEGTECGRNCHCDEEFAEGTDIALAQSTGLPFVPERDPAQEPSYFGQFANIQDAHDFAKKLGVAADYGSEPSLLPANLMNEVLRVAHQRGLSLPAAVRMDADFILRYAAGGDSVEARRTPALFRAENNTIYINPTATWWRNPLYAAQRNFIDVNNYTAQNPLHVLQNEMGHVGHYANAPSKYDALRSGWSGKVEQIDLRQSLDVIETAFGPRADGRYLYMRSDPREFVAEVYAGIMSGVSFPPEVMELYDQLGGLRP